MSKLIGQIMSVAVVLFIGYSTVSYIAPDANASRLESGNNTRIYIDVKSGDQINALDADKRTTNDEPVMECHLVEKVCNERTGKCTVKKVK